MSLSISPVGDKGFIVSTAHPELNIYGKPFPGNRLALSLTSRYLEHNPFPLGASTQIEVPAAVICANTNKKDLLIQNSRFSNIILFVFSARGSESLVPEKSHG